jgi:dTMP kinase
MRARSKGLLVAFEGLDQSGKQTQAEALREHLSRLGRTCRLVSFPDYTTPIGSEINRGLHGERAYGPDVMQLLYVANRHERKPDIEQALDTGVTIVCDRYVASSVAYGEAQGLDPAWLESIQRFLPAPDVCILLDIGPETASRRKAAGRDIYERDLALLARVRKSYHRQAAASHLWVRLDGERPRETVHADVVSAVAPRLALP